MLEWEPPASRLAKAGDLFISFIWREGWMVSNFPLSSEIRSSGLGSGSLAPNDTNLSGRKELLRNKKVRWWGELTNRS